VTRSETEGDIMQDDDGPSYYIQGCHTIVDHLPVHRTLYALRFPIEDDQILTVFVHATGLEAFHAMLHEVRLDAFIDGVLEEE
jgi:hypothetical protein